MRIFHPITVDPLRAPCLLLDPRSDDPNATPGDNISEICTSKIFLPAALSLSKELNSFSCTYE